MADFVIEMGDEEITVGEMLKRFKDEIALVFDPIGLYSAKSDRYVALCLIELKNAGKISDYQITGEMEPKMPSTKGRIY